MFIEMKNKIINTEYISFIDKNEDGSIVIHINGGFYVTYKDVETANDFIEKFNNSRMYLQKVQDDCNHMDDDEREMRQAVLKLRGICKKRKDCYGCPAYDGDDGCRFDIINWTYPYYWDLPIPEPHEGE